MNSQDAKVMAIDLPTGVSSDDGEVDKHAIRAHYTYALHGYKPSAFLFPSSEYYGETIAVDIGLPQRSGWKVWTKEDVMNTLPAKNTNTHKGTFGNGLLIAGSDEMPGSAGLSAIGALRFGIGKLSIATTKHASSIIGPLAPEGGRTLFCRCHWTGSKSRSRFRKEHYRDIKTTYSYYFRCRGIKSKKL
jgi:hypothetical protein